MFVVKIFERGLEFGRLGWEFRKSHQMKGGYWEGRFVLGR